MLYCTFITQLYSKYDDDECSVEICNHVLYIYNKPETFLILKVYQES